MLNVPLPAPGYLEAVGRINPERARRESSLALEHLYSTLSQRSPEHPLLSSRISVDKYVCKPSDWYSLGRSLEKIAEELLRLVEKKFVMIPAPIDNTPNRTWQTGGF